MLQGRPLLLPAPRELLPRIYIGLILAVCHFQLPFRFSVDTRVFEEDYCPRVRFAEESLRREDKLLREEESTRR